MHTSNYFESNNSMSVTMPVPQKIVLKSSTSISLNDRFSAIIQQRPITSAQTVRVQLADQQQASAKNRRLALQMANRPNIQAAMGGGGMGDYEPITNRLGFAPPSNVHSRLGMPGSGRGRGRGRGRSSFRGQGRGGGPNYFIENSENEDMGLQSYQPESVPRRRGRGRGRGQAANNTPRGFGNPTRIARGSGRGMGRGLGRGVGRGAGRGMQRGGGTGRGGRGQQGNAPRQWRSWGRGRGRGGFGYRIKQEPVPTREQLDNQLDQYMAGTKTEVVV